MAAKIRGSFAFVLEGAAMSGLTRGTRRAKIGRKRGGAGRRSILEETRAL